jgi:NADPH-dependent curcumin reductase CurA
VIATPALQRQWILRAYPDGVPGPGTFDLVQAAVASPREGEVTVRADYFSMDPFPRLRLDPAARLAPPLPLGSVMIGRGAGIVVASGSNELRVGDAVVGELGWQEYATVAAGAVRRVEPSGAPLAAALHVLGSSGLAPYFALTEVAHVQVGETVVVTAAAGSVGIAAGQIARELGARAVGVVRGEEQRRFLAGRHGYEQVVDGDASSADARIADACPRGIDVLIDSVGGTLHDRLMERIAPRARVVLLGFISAYNAPGDSPPAYGRIYQVIRQRATVSGFLLPDFAPRFAAAQSVLAGWVLSGRLEMPESITEGFERMPGAFAAMFGAAEPGKHLVRVAPPGPDDQAEASSKE